MQASRCTTTTPCRRLLLLRRMRLACISLRTRYVAVHTSRLLLKIFSGFRWCLFMCTSVYVGSTMDVSVKHVRIFVVRYCAYGFAANMQTKAAAPLVVVGGRYLLAISRP